MAFIRRVRTASGATAVQIAEYANGRQRIVKHLGSAHTDTELGVLLEQARELLGDPGQSELDLGVEPAPRVAGMVGAPASQGALDLPAAASAVVPVRRDEPGRVVATESRLVYEALASVYTSLGFDSLEDPVFRDLVIARIVEATSLLDSGRVLADLGRRPASYATMKRTLGRAKPGRYRDTVAKACFNHAVSNGDVSLCLYDVTTLYFEAEKEDELRKVGFSNYAAVLVMPRSSCAGWCSCWSAASLGAAGAAYE